MTIHVHLDGAGKPRFQPDVHQPEIAVEKIVIQHSLRTFCKDQSWSLICVGQLDAATGFLSTQHRDQSFGEIVAANDVLNELFFAKSSLPVFVGTTGFRSKGFGVIDQLLRCEKANSP